jgi:predicted  nucleic acid-binding Zn-ribbon protein
MSNIPQKLFDLQELELIVDESRILHRQDIDEHTAEIQAKISSLRESLDGECLRRFDRLRKQGMAVAKLESGVCGGCRLNIPQGEILRMRKAEEPPACPNCGRFLLPVD